MSSKDICILTRGCNYYTWTKSNSWNSGPLPSYDPYSSLANFNNFNQLGKCYLQTNPEELQYDINAVGGRADCRDCREPNCQEPLDYPSA